MASELEAKVRRALWSIGDKPCTSVYERQTSIVLKLMVFELLSLAANLNRDTGSFAPNNSVLE